ncbi:competence protein CoiA family protein [Anaeromyxobacter oryzisoli]|uniref:competence protein CoiA family protein n=1 Tax=Anaeromyxobacter oryzisoli TaxID=2925408 RepID=UPI001F58AB45|nr:competence protein CoiA family protein [Anaeromyxobacter sp. SG63]
MARTQVSQGEPHGPDGRAGPDDRRRARATRSDVQLAWARDRDGNKVHVGRIDPRDRRARGPFTCLGCGEPLVPHLGQRRARHFAHLPGSTCPLTAPETALHLDAKERLLALCVEAFAGVRRVTLLTRCPSCRRLAPRDLAGEGDGAVGEGAVGPLRADVLVTRAGAPRLALEVLVTHAVEPEKEAALAAAAVPAAEIDAREEWEERDEDGAVRVAVARSLGFPPCPACAAQARADADRGRGGEAAEIAELEAYRARGLLGPTPGRRPAPGGRGAGGATGPADGDGPPADRPLDPDERAALEARFRCPDCGGAGIVFGERLARHACPGQRARPIAWRGYEGAVIELSWWRRGRG